MKTHYKAVMQLIKTGHWLTDSVSKELKQYDIYEPQFNVLRILQGSKLSLGAIGPLESLDGYDEIADLF